MYLFIQGMLFHNKLYQHHFNLVVHKCTEITRNNGFFDTQRGS